MTPEQRKTLNASIQSLRNDDYSAPCSGYRQDLYIDPEKHTVYVFTCVGAGIPAAAWHNRQVQILRIPADAIAESVCNAVLMVEERLAELCDRYLGSEWDGSNHVGRWAEDGGGVLEWVGDRIPEIACYWDAGDWFSGDGTDDDIRARLRSGKKPQEILADLYLGDESIGEVREADALEWIKGLAAETDDD